MKGLADPIDRLPAEQARELLGRVREILWPEERPNEEWSPDHLGLVAELLAELRPATVDCSLCGSEAYAHVAHLHQGQWIGLCCWDERLRASE